MLLTLLAAGGLAATPAPTPPPTHAASVERLYRVEPLGAALLVADLDHLVRWDLATGRVVRYDTGEEPVRRFAVSPDGARLAIAARGVSVWEAATGRLLAAWDVGTEVRDLGWSGADLLTVTAVGAPRWDARLRPVPGDPGGLRRWDPLTGAERGGPTPGVTWIDTGPEGLVVEHGDGRARLTRDGALLDTVDDGTVTWGAAGRRFAVQHGATIATFHDIDSGAHRGYALADELAVVGLFDGDRAALVVKEEDGALSLVVHDTSDGAVVAERAFPGEPALERLFGRYERGSDWVRDRGFGPPAAFSAAAGAVAFARSTGTFAIVDLPRFTLRELGGTGDAPIRSVAFDDAGERVAAQTADGTVRVWRVGDGKLLHTLATGLPEAVLRLTPTALTLQSGEDPGATIHAWSFSTGRWGATLRSAPPG